MYLKCMYVVNSYRYVIIITIIIFLHGLGHLTCSGIDALPWFLYVIVKMAKMLYYILLRV